MTDEKITAVKPEEAAQDSADSPKLWEHTWVNDMKQELEDYIEEQGIYIRQ